MKKLLFFLFGITLSLRAQFAGGSGTPLDPYQITNETQLDSMRNHLSSYFKMMNDITITKANWIPVGGYNVAFAGGFDGGNYTISNMKITSVTDYYIGFLGNNNGNIKRVTFKNVNINVVTALYYCYAGVVWGDGGGGDYVDSIFVNGANINIQYTGGGWAFFGGMAGRASGRFRYCGIQNLTMTILTKAVSPIGGFVGQLNVSAIESFAQGTITATKEPGTNTTYVGGFVGQMYLTSGYISNCYSRVNINIGGSLGWSILAGFVNYKFGGTFCSNDYAAGVHQILDPSSRRNGFIDYNTDGSLSTTYFDSTVLGSSKDNLQGGPGGGSNPRSTIQMKTQSNYVGWDFVNVWAISPTVNDGYPYLRRNPPRLDVITRLRVRR